MNNRLISIGIVCLLVIAGFLGLITFESKVTGASTFYVGGTGSDNYTSIQAAIDAASTGSIIFVYDDSAPYYESIDIHKTINLVGENRDTTIIDGSSAGAVISVSADWVNITGFTITNANHGIVLDSSSNNIITNNDVTYNFEGIWLFSSSNNIIINNNVPNNTLGISLAFSSNNNITSNNVSANNQLGISIFSSSNNNITNNTVSNNSNYGIYLDSSSTNTIYHNNFIDNANQAFDNTNNGNQWDDDYPSGGNYWSDYGGVDNFKGPNQDISGSDGIGDTLYIIDADSQDNYPLIQPYKPFENYIILKQGWNLISIPLIQQEQNLTKVLDSIDGYYDAVQWYDVTDATDPWEHYKVGKPFGNDLNELNETMGFWIHITQPGDTIFLCNGTLPTVNQTITLRPGWNLVGYPTLTSYNRTTGLNNLTFDTHVDSIWTYYAATQKWKEIGPSDYFEIRRGYWVHARVKCEWEVPL